MTKFRYSGLITIIYYLERLLDLLKAFLTWFHAFYQKRKKEVLTGAMISAGILVFIILINVLLSFVSAKVYEKIENVFNTIEKKTGIIIQCKDLDVSPPGSITLKGISLSFYKNGIPFLTVSEMEIKGSPVDFLSAYRIHGLVLRKPAAKLGMDTIGRLIALSRDLLTNTADQSPGTQHADTGKNLVQLSKNIKIDVQAGKLFIARTLGQWFAHPASLLRVKATISLDLEEKTAAGSFTGSGLYNHDNVKGEFLAREFYQTMNLDLNQFVLQQFATFLPGAFDESKTASVCARITMHRFYSDPRVYFDIKSTVDNISLYHDSLASRVIHHINTGLNGKLTFNLRQKTIRSSDLCLVMGKAICHLNDFYFRIPAEQPLLCYVKIKTGHLPLQDIIDSLPAELIPHIKGAEVDGFMNIVLDMDIDMEDIERTNVNFEGGIYGFRVNTPPALCDIRKIRNSDFVHKVVTQDNSLVSFVVGPENSDFVSFNDAGRFVIETVLTCEDGNFFVHNGFQLKHINQSIRMNLREKTFKRGASTVTMQLAKNLYLCGEKTVSRKLEEVMLTWWMEHELEKKRMFEVYLNIVEWGPGIYGIGQAAVHYFNCRPNQLSLTQATWLASILVNPSLFYYMKEQGKIDDKWRSLLKFVMEAIRKQGGISEEALDEAARNNFEVYFPPSPSEPDIQTDKDVVFNP